MKLKVEVLACDIDKKFPAKTYTITASDGRTISKDLCAEHAEPFEEWLEEAEVDEDSGEESSPEPQPEPEPAAPVPAQKKEPAAKKAAPAKRAPAKKATTQRRRPKIVSLEEIEASKQG